MNLGAEPPCIELCQVPPPTGAMHGVVVVIYMASK